MRKIIPNNAVLIPDDAKQAFTGYIFDVYQWQQKVFDGSVGKFEMLKRADTVIGLCLVDGKILVLDEEQPHHGHRINFPMGRVESSEKSILEAAKREIVEETGYEFSNWRLLDVSQFYTKIEWFIYIYLAWGVKKQVPTKHDPGEKITSDLKTLDEVKKLMDKSPTYIGRARHLLYNINNIDELMALPEFKGKELDR